jgi:AcrR family transcriptional regulator
MKDEGFQRAYTPERKQQRRDDLLEAARRLAQEHGVREVTLTAIATAAGLHKSALLRYFETREALFLQLTAEGWRDWVPACLAGMAAAGGDPQAIADVMARTLAERPLFCDLLGQAPMNLERDVSVESVRDFKLATLEQVEILAEGIARMLQPLTPRQGRQVVSMVAGLAGALWQISHPAPPVGRLYAVEPRLAHAAVDFEPTLRSDVEVIIEGTLRVATGTATAV